MVIKGLKSVIPVKNVIIIHVINLRYIPVTKVVNVNYRYYNYRVQDRGSSALYFFFFHLPLYTLFLLNLFLKLK